MKKGSYEENCVMSFWCGFHGQFIDNKAQASEHPNCDLVLVKENAQHTPTPWKLFTNLDNNYSKDIFSKDKRRIVAGLSSDDAEFIVKAVNSHDLLLNALKDARQSYINREEGTTNEDYKIILEMDKAIAQAEGK